MSRPICKDPVETLKTRIVKYGKSGSHGIYLFGTILAVSPLSHIHSDTAEVANEYVGHFLRSESGADLVASLLLTKDNHLTAMVPHYLQNGGTDLNVFREGGLLNFLTVIPSVEVQDFDEQLEIWSHLAMTLCKLANCDVGHLQIMIANAFMSWERMEEEKLLYVPEFESN